MVHVQHRHVDRVRVRGGDVLGALHPDVLEGPAGRARRAVGDAELPAVPLLEGALEGHDSGESTGAVRPVHRVRSVPPAVRQPTLASAAAERETRLGSRRDGMGLELKLVAIDKPADVNFILGQSHFIKTVEDLYEALVLLRPRHQVRPRLLRGLGRVPRARTEGTDEAMKAVAVAAAQAIGAGHSFVIVLQGRLPGQRAERGQGLPGGVPDLLRHRQPAAGVVAETEQGRGILGVVDGSSPKGVEDAAGIAWRQELLQKFGYKR